MKKGDVVEVKKSWYSDIRPGMRGCIRKHKQGGFVIEITAEFSTFSEANCPVKREETRFVFFDRSDLRRVHSSE